MGQLVATTNCLNRVPGDEIAQALARHLDGDWGNLCDEDWDLNNEALEVGNRLHSSYKAQDGTVFWIITECDRSATTVLLPEDY